MFGTRLNSRANYRLQMLGKLFNDVLDEKIQKMNKKELSLTLELKEPEYISEIELKYSLQNRFFSRIYDLIIESTLSFQEGEETLITLNYKGFNKITGAYFDEKTGNEQGKRIAQKLNYPQILDKFLEFNFPRFDIRYSPTSKTWNIKATSIIGSTTWILIPPIFQTIKPTSKECLQILKLFELVAYVISTENKN